MSRIRVIAPGRVNLIGGHTDYTGGLVLPMAIDLATTIEGERGGDRVRLSSADEPEPCDLGLAIDDPAAVSPAWAKYVAGVIAEVLPVEGFTGTVSTTLPIGTGLSSSAALEVAVALALDAQRGRSHGELASLLRRGENRASGVPSGIMDQLASLAGVAGHAVLLDCTSLAVTAVPLPDDIDVVVIDSGQRRRLAETGYGDRRREVGEAEALLGHLPGASLAAVEAIENPAVRARARHVVTENARVREFVDAIAAGDRKTAGEIMQASHASLRDNQQVTTPELDSLVERLCATPGVWGARLTGGGWGGCVVALAEPGALTEGWLVKPSDGARVEAL